MKLAALAWLCAVTALAQQQRLPRQTPVSTASAQGIFRDSTGLGLGGVAVTFLNLESGQMVSAVSSGDGVFRILNLPPGRYALQAERDGFQSVQQTGIVLNAGDVFAADFTLQPVPAVPRPAPPEPPQQPSYRILPAPPPEGLPDVLPPQIIPPRERVFTPVPDRWKFDWPDYQRYGPADEKAETPYVKGRWYDPFNRNKLKGDYPIFGQSTFLNLNLVSDTAVTGRKLPVPSGVGSYDPDSGQFFGRMGQFALSQNFSFSATLFHGDTAYRPVDWQIKFTPEVNVNYLKVQENGIVSPDVRAGTTRLDAHAGLQEAFVEAKIADLSSSFDFLSARAGIQTFNSDFRGFVFFDQEPGLRLFGTLDSNRYQFNAAYFSMLEKDTNSGLNSMQYRNQQVLVGNLYRQDFLKPGYNIQVSFHYDKDDASLQYDTNGFLVRPAAVGLAQPHKVRAYYYGLTGDGHIGRLNLTHAFYQVLGYDSLNPIAGRRTDSNAQMAAAELSWDRDWIRFRASIFWTSGDDNPRDGTARGFDSILDNSNFAGGFFSFWNREGIRLTGSAVSLVSPGSLIPSLRSSELQGQANFVNPGIFIFNGGGDVEITPKLRGVLNVNVIRFDHTEPLELILLQAPIHHGVGTDSGLGLVYRPPLSENMVITGAFNAFSPMQGFRDIFTDKT
ncbi:MAG TPA: carboxypeptidase-like regulatory domain-containing protein, partial [Bryobacteraceae bacterium]|nr:carboxypeptidase-like regulatory domain-containing protein [Bryobacteraceae bacterium]